MVASGHRASGSGGLGAFEYWLLGSELGYVGGGCGRYVGVLVRGGVTTEGRVRQGMAVVGVLAVDVIFFSNLLIKVGVRLPPSLVFDGFWKSMVTAKSANILCWCVMWLGRVSSAGSSIELLTSLDSNNSFLTESNCLRTSSRVAARASLSLDI
jgi:hypothetical protein